MKIYILPVHGNYQPANQPFLYPKYNDDYGVEQDFLAYLLANTNLITLNAQKADWHYLPIFWTRYHLNRRRRHQGLPELQEEINRLIQDDKRTFTVCQFDDGPIVDIGKTLQCLSSRKNSKTFGIDIPLLASPIPNLSNHLHEIKKSYLASFTGQFKNHPIRPELKSLLKNRSDVYFEDGDFGIEVFVHQIIASKIGICPRGYGGSSFRLYEVMQLGRIPLMVGDVDIRPFKQFINWEDVSFYVDNAEGVSSLLDYALTRNLDKMGILARKTWESLQYQNWCKYLLLEIEKYK